MRKNITHVEIRLIRLQSSDIILCSSPRGTTPGMDLNGFGSGSDAAVSSRYYDDEEY